MATFFSNSYSSCWCSKIQNNAKLDKKKLQKLIKNRNISTNDDNGSLGEEEDSIVEVVVMIIIIHPSCVCMCVARERVQAGTK